MYKHFTSALLVSVPHTVTVMFRMWGLRNDATVSLSVMGTFIYNKAIDS